MNSDGQTLDRAGFDFPIFDSLPEIISKTPCFEILPPKSPRRFPLSPIGLARFSETYHSCRLFAPRNRDMVFEMILEVMVFAEVILEMILQ